MIPARLCILRSSNEKFGAQADLVFIEDGSWIFVVIKLWKDLLLGKKIKNIVGILKDQLVSDLMFFYLYSCQQLSPCNKISEKQWSEDLYCR